MLSAKVSIKEVIKKIDVYHTARMTLGKQLEMSKQVS